MVSAILWGQHLLLIMPILLQDGSDHEEGEEAECDEEEDEMEVDSSDESVSEEEKGTMPAFILMF